MSTRRGNVSFIYFAVVAATLLLRISFSLGAGEGHLVSSDAFFTLMVQLLIFGLMPTVLYFVLCKNGDFHQIDSLFKDFGFVKCRIGDIGLSFVLGILMVFLATIISWAWSSVLTALGYVSVPSSTDFSSLDVLFAEIFLTALLPGVFEEFTHRGLLFAGFRTTSSDGWKVVLISALMFSLMHQNITQTGYTFVDGVLLALVAYYTGSIFPAMIIHFTNNFIAVLVDYFEQNPTYATLQIEKVYDWLWNGKGGFAVYLVLALLALGAIVLILVYMRRNAHKKGLLINDGNLSEGKYPVFAPDMRGGIVEVGKPSVKDNVFTYVTVAMGVVAAVFSFVWGLMR